ncbi:MAG: energy transducer TonB [Acidobacteria bacterium]|nr:energy transducer TonB [Acidobacteriota bacterium]
MNGKLNYQYAGGNTGYDPGLPATWAMEAEEDSRNFKIALLVAILAHVLLLWVVLPGNSSDVKGERIHPQKPLVRIILKVPPKDSLDILVMKPHSRLVPVPDPTPEDPEPAVSINAVNKSTVPVNDFIPDDNVPDNIDPLDIHTAGLTAPVYSMAQLQRNVVYPPLGITAGLHGYVVVQAVLNRDGTVTDVKVIGGTLKGFGFPEAAKSAVRKLAFRPGFYHGRPVSVVMNLTIHFRLTR